MLLTLTLFIFTFFIGQNKAFDSLSKVGCLDLKPFDPIYIQDTPIPFKESTYVWTYLENSNTQSYIFEVNVSVLNSNVWLMSFGQGVEFRN